MLDPTKSYIAVRTEIPFGEREIPNYAFAYYSDLSEVNLPIATKIGKYAFLLCSDIKTLEFPKTTQIGDAAFQLCGSLVSIDAPLATSIGAKAFSECTSLVDVNLPELVSAGNAAFNNCSSLETLNLAKLSEFKDNLLQNCSNLVNVISPNVTKIGKNVFRGCQSLKDIILTKVTSIGTVPFVGCSKLQSVELPSITEFPDGILGSWDNTFTELKYVNLRKATQLYQSFFQGARGLRCINLSSLQYGLVNAARSDWGIPSSCDILCSGGWIETQKEGIDTRLKNEGEVLPEGEVVQRVFYKTSGLKDTVLDENIDLYDPLIGVVYGNSFKDKLNLSRVYFPVAWSIGTQTFKGCTNLRQIRLPSIYKTQNIGNNAFENCTSLAYLDLESMNMNSVMEKKDAWGIPEGCTVLCSDGTIIS